MRFFLFTLLILSVVSVSACAAPSDPTGDSLSAGERQLVGTWTADIEFARWVVTRRADHTFTERFIGIYDYAKPAIRVESTGTWRVHNGQYCRRYTSVSHPRWQPLVGRERCERLLDPTASHLDYKPKDGPRVTEHRPSLFESLFPLRLTGAHRKHPVEAARP